MEKLPKNHKVLTSATETVQSENCASPRAATMEKSREGEIAVGCQLSQWIVAVTEERDETGGGGGRLYPLTVETIGNHVRV